MRFGCMHKRSPAVVGVPFDMWLGCTLQDSSIIQRSGVRECDIECASFACDACVLSGLCAIINGICHRAQML